MTTIMEKHLSDELPVDDYLLESTDPRWNKPASLHSVRIASTRLDARIDQLVLKLEREIARLESKIK